MDTKVVIDVDQCIGCGLCAKDCVSFNIEIINNKATLQSSSCIQCGHCEAICPTHAVSLEGFEDIIYDYDFQTRLDPNALLKAIQTRRSIRHFLDKRIDDEIINKIIEAGRLAPTGTNSQNISYIILDKKKEECEKIAVSLFSKVLSLLKRFNKSWNHLVIDDNFFFKKAPLVIIVLSNDKVNASLAASNISYMAEAYGLGVLYSGFFTMAYNLSRKIRKIAGSEKKAKAVTTLVIGYPLYQYKRTVHRKQADIIHS